MTKFITEKQKQFVQTYLTNGCNGKEAAISAGYAPAGAAVQASRNLAKPIVLDYISHLQRQLEEERETNILDVEAELCDVYRTARAEHSFQAANRSLELLGKIRGSFAPEKRSISTTNITHNAFGLSGEDDPASVQADIEKLLVIAGYKNIKPEEGSASTNKN